MQGMEITRIKPSGSWIDLNFGELWGHRDLLYFLTLRDIKIRYKQAAIGVAWAVLQPVVTVSWIGILRDNLGDHREAARWYVD